MEPSKTTQLDAATQHLVDDIATDIASPAAEWTDEDRRVLAAIFPALARGRAADPGDVARESDIDVTVVEDVLERYGEQLQTDEAGRIVGWSGLTLEQTRHAVDTGGTRLYAWCALDPYFIAPVLGTELTVSSTNPVTETAVVVRIHADGTFEAPGSAAATLVNRGSERLSMDIIANFGDLVHHFPSREAAERFEPDGADPLVVDLEVLAATGQAIYEWVWAP